MGRLPATHGLNRDEEVVTQRFVQVVREKCGGNLRAVVLYGSKARGDYTQHSDLDILLLLGKTAPRIRRKAVDWASDCARNADFVLLSPQVMSAKEWGFEKACRSLFYREVRRDGKVLWGTL